MKKSRSVAGIAIAVSALVVIVAGANTFRANRELAANSQAQCRRIADA